MKRITAEYIYTLESEPIRNGFIEYDDNGIIAAVGQCEADEEIMPGAQPR
jgi:hypothetical protein